MLRAISQIVFSVCRLHHIFCAKPSSTKTLFGHGVPHRGEPGISLVINNIPFEASWL